VNHDKELAAQAAAGDVEAQFDLLLRRVSGNGTETAPPPGMAKLALRPQAERRILRKAFRSMCRVDQTLVATFRKLAAGKAPWPLYLHGPVGTGKTMAALALCDFADSAAYYTVDGLCSLIVAGSPEAVAEEWSQMEGKALVVLDEIGEREKVGDLHYSAVKQMLDTRDLHAERIAIYISNLEILIPCRSVRLVSRLAFLTLATPLSRATFGPPAR